MLCALVALFLLSWFHAPSLRSQGGPNADAGFMPVDLHVSGLKDPIGLDEAKPSFGWQLHAASTQYNVEQSAYRILVSSSPALIERNHGDLWDSGRVDGRDYLHIPYAGQPLQSHTTYFWKVCVWNVNGRTSACSVTAHWTTALLTPGEWIAKWIAAKADDPLEPQAREGIGERQTTSERLPLFKRTFQLEKPVKQAIVFVSGLGQYELHLNGHSVTDAVMVPGWTNYRKEVLYDTYVVTDMLHKGANTLGVMLGNGMYDVPGIEGRYTKFIGSFGKPKVILQMHIAFADGTQQTIVSDQAWQTEPGPIMLSSIYGGEDYDARKEEPGWDTTSTSSWDHALEVAGPSGSIDVGQTLRSSLIPSMKVMEVIKPVRHSDVHKDTQLYDLGRNFSGWPEIRVKGHRGDIVRILPGELLDGNGEVTQASAGADRRNPVLFTYTLRGDGIESWHPRFTYYGFRYVQVQTVPARETASSPIVLSLVGDFIHDDVVRDGQFHSEAPLLDKIHHLIDQAILSNLASVLTDCPTREKLGWLEQTYLNGGSVMYNYDVAELYRKVADDMSEAQIANGMVPGIAPEYVAFVDKEGKSTAFRDSPEWGSAIILSPWTSYQFYGDIRVLAEHYDSMAHYVAYLKSRSVDHLLSFGLGDWYDVGPGSPGESQLTSKGLTATAIYFEDLETLARIARVLNKPADAERYTVEAADVKKAFNQALYHPNTKTYDRGSQTADAMALFLGLVPAQDRGDVLKNLVADIRAHQNHVTAGDVGFHYVVAALSKYGRSDVLYDMVTRTDSPSYGYQLSKGATTLTEAWDTNPGSSQNHFMLGHAEEWFYRGLAGIDLDLSRADDERIRVKPALASGAPGASATIGTVLGTVASTWHRTGNVWSAEFVIPAGAKATVVLPMGATSNDVHTNPEPGEYGEPGGEAPHSQKWILGSGKYRFAGNL